MSSIQPSDRRRRVCGDTSITINSSGMRLNPTLPRCDDIRLALREQHKRQLQHQPRAGQQGCDTDEQGSSCCSSHEALRRRIASQIRTALLNSSNKSGSNAKSGDTKRRA